MRRRIEGDQMNEIPGTTPRPSATFSDDINSEIRRAAATGIYDFRDGGAKRKVPHFYTHCFWGLRCRAIRWKGAAKNVRHQ